VQLDYASRPPGTRRIDRWLVLLFLVGFAARLAWVIHLPVDAASLDRLPDQAQYLELGRNLLAHQGLHFVDGRFNDTLYAFRTPGYPLFIAWCQGNIRVVRIAQAIIDASVMVAAYLLARRCGGDRLAARVAAAIVAFNPFLIFFCGLLLSETLFTAMLVWGMTFLLLTSRRIWWLVGIVLLVLSIHVRPSALMLPVILAIFAAFVNRDRPRLYDARWSPPVGTFALLLTIMILLPWAWRNSRVVGSWIFTTTNGGLSLYDGLNPDATGASDQSFTRTMPQLQAMDEVGRDRYLNELAWKFAREHPQRVVELTVIKIVRMWSPVPLSQEYGGKPLLVATAASYMVPFFVLIIVGVRLGSAARAAKAYLLAPAAYFTVVHAVSVGSIRYRVPADVPMAILAGIGAARLVASMSRKKPLPELVKNA
jgi:hypothetical protein